MEIVYERETSIVINRPMLMPIFFCFDCRISFADPVAVRHSLAIISELAAKDPYSVAMALGQ